MEKTTRYQIIGECAYVTVDTATGKARTLLYKGAVFDASAPEVAHLVSAGLARPVDGEVTGGVNADGEPAGPQRPPVTDTPIAGSTEETAQAKLAQGSEDAQPAPEPATGEAKDTEAKDTEAKRAAARAKLPTDGSAPDGRASQDVWVEYAVTRGMDRDEAEKASRADLIQALRG